MPGKNSLVTSPIHTLPISPGIAIGPAQIYKPLAKRASVDKIDTTHIEIEQERLHAALAAALDELQQLSEHVEQTVGSSEADIFAAQQLMLEDPDLLEEIQRLISEEHFPAASALQQASES